MLIAIITLKAFCSHTYVVGCAKSAPARNLRGAR